MISSGVCLLRFMRVLSAFAGRPDSHNAWIKGVGSLQLKQSIARYRNTRSENPKPFTWTASVAEILAKVERANTILATLH